jgi:peptidoglycan/xylan/chitin deacetylase (PgdA/CDA1 family)
MTIALLRSGITTFIAIVACVISANNSRANEVLSAAPVRTEPLAFYVNYSARVPTAPLVAHALSIVHPDAKLDIEAAHRAGNTVLAYLSVGEVASDAPYRAEILSRQLPFASRNATWNSDIVDLTDTRWIDYFVTQLAPAALDRGFDGLFLDTLDAIELVTPNNSARISALRAGLVTLIRRLHTAFPTKHIVVNRGFTLFDEIRDSIDGVLAESLFETHDFASNTSRAVSAEETSSLLSQLQRIRAAGRQVYVLDYTDPTDATRAITAANRIRALGFHAFVSTPALDGTMLAPLRPVPRRICSFYGNLTTVQEDQVKWPAESFTGQRLQTPLEWLGYEVDYFKITTASDLPVLNSDYRAIVLPRFWEIPAALEPAVIDWLVAQRAAGKKILIFGELPFNDPEQRKRFLEAFGLGGTGEFTPPPFTPEIVTKDTAVLDYEAPVYALPVGHRNLRAPPDAHRLLTVRATFKIGAPVIFDAAFTCSWGGMACDPYLIFRRADFRDFWRVDPFAFLKLALGENLGPVPDTTTRDGLRLFLNHIDGDGFSNFSRVEPGQRSAEIILDRILKKYPLPVTVSVIEAEVRALIRTQRSEDAPALEAIAREIFALPQVEAASHTYSHPFFWIEGDRTESFYDEQKLDLKIPYPQLDLAREIEGSVNYINQKLTPPGRPVRVFLWSGNCRPPPAALALTRKLGIENLNGGDTLITARNRTLTAVAPRTMPWGDELQIYAPNQNENVYTNNWRGPLFGTFIHVLDTYALTEAPRRLKPVNLYYHFYSGDYLASLRALETIYDWVIAQPLHALSVSAYARLARDARATSIFSSGPARWLIVNHGDSRTLRLPAALAARIDLAHSRGITGWKTEGDQAYVHTDGSPAATLTLASGPVAYPRLESSSAEITFHTRRADTCSFTVRDLRPITTIFAGLKPASAVHAAINGKSHNLRATTTGTVVLTLPPQSEVVLDFHPSATSSTP